MKSSSSLLAPYHAIYTFAAKAHHTQSYGGAAKGQQVPYVEHIEDVAMQIIRAELAAPGSIDLSIAIPCALLHDVIEDTPHTYEDVKERFGQVVADGVLALTKNETLPSKAEQMADSLERIRQQPAEVWMVKLADRICNLSHPPFYWKGKKVLSYQQEAMGIHDALHTAHPFLAERLRLSIDRYQHFAAGR